MNCEVVRKGENILKLEFIKGVVWRALENGMGIMIGCGMNHECPYGNCMVVRTKTTEGKHE